MSKRGFTLIEVMIVLAIIASLIVVAAPRLSKNDANIKSVARNLITLSKEVRNKARLSSSTYRIAIDLNEKGDQYWVEKANGPQTIDPEAYQKAKDRDEKDAPPSLFQKENSVLKQDKSLPRGLRFTSVETVNSQGAITSGIAYIHYSPEGFVEESALQISNGNNLTWTLVFNPLTGQADIIEKAQSLKEVQR